MVAALGGGASGGATRLREIQLAAASPSFQNTTPTGRSAHAATLVHSSSALTTAARPPSMTMPLKQSTPYPSPSETQKTRGATCAPTAPCGYSSSSGELARRSSEIASEIEISSEVSPEILPSLVAASSASSASLAAAAAEAAAARRMLAATTSAFSSAVWPSLRSLHPANRIASPAAKIRMGWGAASSLRSRTCRWPSAASRPLPSLAEARAEPSPVSEVE
mmetsp:Transcript_12754/g.31747  ORF Transcript_12754/g.31747 Transcript_12754/m.31747 type:complete len:222 (+) Transcript_12754:102-767(+)